MASGKQGVGLPRSERCINGRSNVYGADMVTRLSVGVQDHRGSSTQCCYSLFEVLKQEL